MAAAGFALPGLLVAAVVAVAVEPAVAERPPPPLPVRPDCRPAAAAAAAVPPHRERLPPLLSVRWAAAVLLLEPAAPLAALRRPV